MIPAKEKAIELVNKMYDSMDIQDGDLWKSTKQCALITVNELIEVACDISDYDEAVTKEYWQEVKQEIELL